MNKRLLCHFVAILFCCAAAKSQERTAYNSVYLELGGNGILYSVNYDRLFSESFSGRAGLMVVSGFKLFTYTGFIMVPLTGSYLVGSTDHKFEVGGGPLIIVAFGEFSGGARFSEGAVFGTTIIGYRYQPAAGGFNFRASVTPFFSDEGIVPFWIGVSLGYGF